jgi:hypothetical protein
MVLSINCSKAIPKEGYERMCSLFDPCMAKLIKEAKREERLRSTDYEKGNQNRVKTSFHRPKQTLTEAVSSLIQFQKFKSKFSSVRPKYGGTAVLMPTAASKTQRPFTGFFISR